MHPKRDEILRLDAQGLSNQEIADQLGLTKGVVSGITYRHHHPGGAAAADERATGADSWDRKVFETWAERKARRAKEAAWRRKEDSTCASS